MKKISVLIMVAFLVSCIPIRIVDRPPDLTQCIRLGQVVSYKNKPEVAKQELEKKTEKIGGNLLYLWPIQEELRKENGSMVGSAYECT